jgi:hypothetical protein
MAGVVRCGTSALCVCTPNAWGVGWISWRKEEAFGGYVWI